MINAIFSSLPGYIICKDNDGAFIACNRNFSNLVGKTPSYNHEKMTDFTLYKQHFAKAYRAIDKLAMEGKEITTIEPSQDKFKNSLIVICKKTPIITEDSEIKGVIATFDILSRSFTLDRPIILSDFDLDSTQRNIQYSSTQNSSIRFTRQESRCLIYYLIGYSCKEIAQRLGGLSSRTVEMHIQHVYNKTGCSSRKELRDFINSNRAFDLLSSIPH